jgi:hypothetical protein
MYIDGISVTDVDVGEGEMKVTLSTLNGKISLNNLTGLTFIVGTGTYEDNVVFTAKIDDVNNALTHIKYYATSSLATNDTLSIEVDDQGNTGIGGAKKATGSINIILPSGPIVRAPIALNATEDLWRNVLGISIEPSDASQTVFKITLMADNGKLKLQTISGLTFLDGTGIDNPTMTFFGNLQDVNAALSLVVYKPNLNFNGVDYITINATDYNDPIGKTTLVKTKMNLAAANDSPVLAAPKNVQKN